MKKVLSFFIAIFFVFGNVALSQDWNFTRNIHAGQVRGLAVDAKNRLWVIGTNANVLVYDLNRTGTNVTTALVTVTALTVGETDYPINGGGDQGRGMNIGNDGKIYCSTQSGEVFVIDPNTPLTNPMVALRRLNPINVSVTAASATANGNVVVCGVNSANIFAFDNSGESLSITMAGGTVTAGRDVAISADGNDLYIATLTSNIQHWRNQAGTGLADGVTYTFQRAINNPNGSAACQDIFLDGTNQRLWIGIQEATPARFDCWDISGAEPVQLTDLTLTSVGNTSTATGGFTVQRGSYFDGYRAYIGDAYNRVIEFEQPNVKVTIRANTAIVPDVMTPNSFVQIRGASPFTWDAKGPLMTNVDGDYWEAKIGLPLSASGTTLEYKFFTNATDINGGGWEADFVGGGNRTFTVPSQDVVLPVSFVNGVGGIAKDYTPFNPGPNEVAVMFRVNMEGDVNFDKATQHVAVRGTEPFDWGANKLILTREARHANPGQCDYDGTNFWSAVINIPKSLLGTEIQYKFVIIDSPTEDAACGWEDADNRTFVLGGDTTLHWEWYSNVPPVSGVDPVDVNLTIIANTATVPDTLSPNSYVQIRGGAAAFGNWNDQGNAPRMENVDGDYWKLTVTLRGMPGTEIPYKFYTNTTTGIGGGGWEENLGHSSGNRIFTFPDTDQNIVLPVQFVNAIRQGLPQDYTPLVAGADEVAVMFRVNMQGNSNFNKETQFMAVRGGFPASSPNMSAPDWSRNFLLTRETDHANGGSQQYDGTNFWSGVTTIPKSFVNTTIPYKFVILNSASETADVTTWEPDRPSGGNRTFVLGGDTTLHWKYWDDGAPVAVTGTDTVIVTYRVDLSTAIRSRGFTDGDTIEVRSGRESAKHYLSGANPSIKRLGKVGLTGNIYEARDTLIGELGGKMYYQYYLWKNGDEVKESFYNFDGTTGQIAECRFVILNGTTQWSTTNVQDVVANTITDMRRQPDFPNMERLSKEVIVKMVCDLRPAYYTLLAGYELPCEQTGVILVPEDAGRLYDELGVWLNGPMVGGWTAWGTSLRDSTSKKMHDDGTNGDDVAGDRKYTVLVTLGPNAPYDRQRNIGQEFKFGIWGLDNEMGYGNNHFANIDDATGAFTLEVQFGSIHPNRYPGWNFDSQEPTIDVKQLGDVPDKYALEQNYPNPFNPSTIIRYDIIKSSNVSLKIYDIMGREVTTLVNDVQTAGRYEVMFSAKNLSSGVYFYRLIADDFTAIKKMVLMK